jgi:hypothetical protein
VLHRARSDKGSQQISPPKVIHTSSAVLKQRVVHVNRALMQSGLMLGPERAARRAPVEGTSISFTRRFLELAGKPCRKSLKCAGRAEPSQPQIKLTFLLHVVQSNLHTTGITQSITVLQLLSLLLIDLSLSTLIIAS